MIRARFKLVCLTAGMIALGTPMACDRGVPTERSPAGLPVIKSRDLLKSVRVIGELGEPLGEVLTLRGRWEYSPEDRELSAKGQVRKEAAELRLRVLDVNGKTLRDRVEFRRSMVDRVQSYNDATELPEFKDGQVWEMIGIENSGMQGMSPSTETEIARIAAELRGSDRVPQQQSFDEFQGAFVSEFLFVKATRIESDSPD